MESREKLHNVETSFTEAKEEKGVDSSLSLAVDKIFLLEKEMLSSIDHSIQPETRKMIAHKMEHQKKILHEMIARELQTQERMKRIVRPVLDDTYFSKKPLNVDLL